MQQLNGLRADERRLLGSVYGSRVAGRQRGRDLADEDSESGKFPQADTDERRARAARVLRSPVSPGGRIAHQRAISRACAA